MGDCKELYAALCYEDRGSELNQIINASITILVKDIVRLARDYGYKFMCVSREPVSNVYSVAKIARHQNKSYTISWVM